MRRLHPEKTTNTYNIEFEGHNVSVTTVMNYERHKIKFVFSVQDEMSEGEQAGLVKRMKTALGNHLSFPTGISEHRDLPAHTIDGKPKSPSVSFYVPNTRYPDITEKTLKAVEGLNQKQGAAKERPQTVQPEGGRSWQTFLSEGSDPTLNLPPPPNN